MTVKFNSRIFSLSLSLGILTWVLDAAMEAYLFREGTFLEMVITDVTTDDLVHRVAFLLLLVTFGLIISHVLFRTEMAEQEASRKALEESEEWFRGLAELLPEPLFEADLDFTITYANQRAFELFGYTQEDFDAGLSGLDMLSPESRERAIASLETRVNGVQSGAVEYTALRKDGSSFPILFHAALYPKDGAPAGIRGIIVDITERKTAEAEVRESEKRFRSIVESTPLGVFLYDLEPDGALVLRAANPAAANILGIDTVAYLGKRIEEAFPPLADTEIPDRYREAAAHGIPWHTEQVDYDYDGIVGAFEVTAFQTSQDQVAVMFLDITERKRAEEALRSSEERLRLATRSGRVGIWEYDIEDDHLEWDDLTFELHGVDRRDDLGGIQEWRECVHPEDLPRAEREFLASLQKGAGPFDSEYRVVRRDDGEVRYIRGLAGVFHDQGGKPIKALGTNWDITEAKRGEKALRESEERFRGIIEQMNDAAYILFEGRFDLVNPRFCELTGVTPEEAAGPEFEFWDLVAPGSVPVIRQRQELREKGEKVPAIYEFDAKHKDGQSVRVEASVREIDYKGGKAILGLLRDMTEHQSLKEELLQAQKMESIGRLSGGVAHDLNNLLTPIIGYGDLLLDGQGLGSEEREDVGEILQAAFRARDLVKQLLAFSRRQPMEFKAIDLNEMLGDFRRLLRGTIREDVEIRIEPCATRPSIRGDRVQLEQVIMNLAVNAQDAMPEGGTLTIETDEAEVGRAPDRGHPGLSQGHYAILRVSDDGLGMEPEIRDRVFEPFFTTKEMGEGTGLGLATVYGIILQHEGDITVKSRPGRGTTFECFLPLADLSALDRVAAKPDLVELRGTETVMVVEDEAPIRSLAVRVLEQGGYAVLQARDGRTCLEILRDYEGPLDLLITDVMMPAMNGRDLHARVMDRFPATRALFMSGYTKDIITHQGVAEEGIHFIQKPFSVQALARKVRMVLEED